MPHETWPLHGLSIPPFHIALAPDGALFGLALHVLPAGDTSVRCGALARLHPEGPEILLRDRLHGAKIVAGAGFVVIVEATEERYVYAASVFDRATGAVTPLPLPECSAGLIAGVTLDDGAVVLPGSEQLYRVEGAGEPVRPLLEGDVGAAQVGMGNDLVAAGGWLVWTTSGDSSAPSQLLRMPVGGGVAESVLRADENGDYGCIAVHGDAIVVAHRRNDPRTGRTLATELLAVDPCTGAVRTVAVLEPVGLRALAVVGGVAWALQNNIGVDAHRVGLRRVDLASGEVTTPEVMADERGVAMVAGEGALFVSSAGGVWRIAVDPSGRPT